MNTRSLVCLVTLALGLALICPAHGQEDWTRFRGPNCDGICKETNLIQKIPSDDPKLLWQINGLGTGYSSVSIVNDKLYTMGDLPDGTKKAQFVIAVDLKSHEQLWATRIGPPHNDGPRCTPTVDGDRLYVLGTSSDLVCLSTSGKVLWKKNLEQDFGGKMMSVWHWSESPLVDGEKVVCTPGTNNAVMVALDKMSGDLIWKSKMPNIGKRGKDGAGYTSMIAAEIDGVRQYVTIVGRGAIGVEAATGKFLWGYNRIANSVANIPTPIVRDNHVFVTTSYKTGSALLQLSRDGDKFNVKEVYFLTPRQFENHHGGVVLIGDYLYGGSGQNGGIPVCIEFLTGKIMWSEKDWTRAVKALGSAAVLYADGQLYFRYEKNAVVALIEANPKRFQVNGLFQAAVSSGPSWAHPVIHDGKLYLRSNDTLMCYNVKR